MYTPILVGKLMLHLLKMVQNGMLSSGSWSIIIIFPLRLQRVFFRPHFCDKAIWIPCRWSNSLVSSLGEPWGKSWNPEGNRWNHQFLDDFLWFMMIYEKKPDNSRNLTSKNGGLLGIYDIMRYDRRINLLYDSWDPVISMLHHPNGEAHDSFGFTDI